MKEQYLLRILIDSLPDRIYIKDSQGRFILVNQAMLDLLGIAEEDAVIGKTDFDFFSDDIARQHYQEEQQIVSSGQGVINQEQFFDDQYGKRYTLTTRVPFRNKQGKILGLIGINRNITDLKYYENSLQQRLQETTQERYKFGSLIGKSPAMQHIYDLITKAAASDATVVITGESGTGKELVAQTIHEMSRRKDKPFIPINCGAIPEQLIESEFFGYKKGAFTGANRDKKGLFDAAHKGTLFLDEVGDIPLSLQVKLLRVLEGRGYFPIGEHVMKFADVRVIAATNREMEELIEQGLIREDFFYRLDVIPIMIPPLRERREDIPLLLEHFVKQFGEMFQHLPGRIFEYFYSHNWPGNIRQLQNTLQRYFVVGTLNEIPPDINSLWEAVKMLEEQMIQDALELHQGHKEKVAEYLQISSRTLRRKMKKYHLD